ncbi:hypothetical protein POV27_08875 [Aureisphaera galaxeae]|uniref:hypothetical protein n=1 Tax=Aureisphaera galaxeae TaxID=1538023 RepID=UPI0023502FDB|nr:hypothetical protein [Aureisphaera galaxeae]MDC8004161.1 hypothetical protein [Aureisphaera galaxeae]
MNIIGKWKGFYEYGEGYDLPYFAKRVGLEITFEGHNDRFIGSTREEPSEYSVPLKGTVEGFVEDGLISFIKRYPKKPVILERHKIGIEFEEGQSEIEHTGVVDEEHQAIHGSWTIYDVVEDEQGTYEYAAHGIWLLKRVD